MTQKEFIQYWSASRGPEFATEWGWVRKGHVPRMAVPCDGDCGFDDCKGWIMASAEPEDAAFYVVQHPQFADWVPERIKQDVRFIEELQSWSQPPA